MSFWKRAPILALLALPALACGAPEGDPQIVETKTSVVSLLDVPKAKDGVAPGFDLDQYTSDQSDGRSCYKADLVAPDGTTGVDNQLATLVPLIDLEGEGALGGLIQQAITDGRLLILFQLHEMDDGRRKLVMMRGEDSPLIGTDGMMLSHQTLALEDSAPMAVIENVEVVGNEFEIGPVDLNIPVVVFDGVYKMHMPQGRIRFQLDGSGRLKSGMMGGGVSSASLAAILDQAAVRLPDFVSLVRSAIEDAKDLAIQPSGKCDQLSMALTFGAVPAFIYD